MTTLPSTVCGKLILGFTISIFAIFSTHAFLQRDYRKAEMLWMDVEKQLAELSVSKIRALELESCVILMCEKCGETWSPDGLNS